MLKGKNRNVCVVCATLLVTATVRFIADHLLVPLRLSRQALEEKNKSKTKTRDPELYEKQRIVQ